MNLNFGREINILAYVYEWRVIHLSRIDLELGSEIVEKLWITVK